MFDHFEYKITSKKKDSISNGSFSIPSHITLEIAPNPVDIAENREKVTAVLSFGLRMQSDFPNEKWVVGKLIVFDNTGEVFTIKNYEKGTFPGLDIKMVEIKMGNTLWEEGMQVPENLEGQLEIAFDYEYSDNIPSGD